MTQDLLCVVDLQPGFLGRSYCRTWETKRRLAAIVRAIDRWARQDKPVVLLEWADYGDTLREVKEAAANTPRRLTVKKNDDDGGADLLASLRKNDRQVGWSGSRSVYLVGAFGQFCVARTAKGLAHLGVRSKIVVPLCIWAPDWGHQETTAWRDKKNARDASVDHIRSYETEWVCGEYEPKFIMSLPRERKAVTHVFA